MEISTRLKHRHGGQSGSWTCTETRFWSAHLAPDLNSFMMDSLSFCGMSPCMDDTVKLASLIFSVSQST